MVQRWHPRQLVHFYLMLFYQFVAFIYCNSLNIPSAFKPTPLSVQLPHCLATHLSISDSLRLWCYINLLTYLLTLLACGYILTELIHQKSGWSHL